MKGLLLIVIGLLRTIPIGALPMLARAAAFLSSFSRRDQAVYRQNLAVVRGIREPREQNEEIRRNRVHQTLCALETVRAAYAPHRVRFEGEAAFAECLRTAEAEGKGVALVTAHLGPWELLARASSGALERAPLALAKPPRWAAARQQLEDLRRRGGARVLWTEGFDLYRKMIACVRDGGTLILLADQRPQVANHERRGLRLPFCGFETDFVSGPGSLVAKTGCALVVAFCLREGPFRYSLRAQRLVPGEGEDWASESITRSIAQSIEEVILERPVEWMWNYRRWQFSDEQLETAGVFPPPSVLIPKDV